MIHVNVYKPTEITKCIDCNFYMPTSETKGQCRVKPPQAVAVSKQSTVCIDAQIVSFFPEVAPDDGCGEGVKKES